jgi:hypothetical protein
MKKRLLLFTLAVTFSCFVAFAQDFQASGTWEKFPSNYINELLHIYWSLYLHNY